jgi:hypothetical protein
LKAHGSTNTVRPVFVHVARVVQFRVVSSTTCRNVRMQGIPQTDQTSVY